MTIQYHRARAMCRLVGSLEPTSTAEVRNPRDARIMATAEVISGVFQPSDPFWGVGALYLAASELRTLVELAAPCGAALIDREQLAQALGCRAVAAKVLGLAGFFVDGDHWTDFDPDGPALDEAVKITIPQNFFAERLADLAEEMAEIASL